MMDQRQGAASSKGFVISLYMHTYRWEKKSSIAERVSARSIHAVGRKMELVVGPGPANDAEEVESPDYRHHLRLEMSFYHGHKPFIDMASR